MSSVTEVKPDLTMRLVERFKELIAGGALMPGSKLPPERQLAAAFRVSRASLRHALKALEIMGVLRQRVGDGTYLTDDSARVLSEPLQLLFLLDGISLEDLLETRLIVEPELAARAAERATMDDLRAMRASLDVMKMRKENRDEELIQADLAFHRAIFEAARNPLCRRIFSLVHQAMLTSIGITSKIVDWDHTLSFHRPIYEAIERRQAGEARRRMSEHLEDARRLLAQARKQHQKSDLSAILQPLPRAARRHGSQSS